MEYKVIHNGIALYFNTQLCGLFPSNVADLSFLIFLTDIVKGLSILVMSSNNTLCFFSLLSLHLLVEEFLSYLYYFLLGGYVVFICVIYSELLRSLMFSFSFLFKYLRSEISPYQI